MLSINRHQPYNSLLFALSPVDSATHQLPLCVLVVTNNLTTWLPKYIYIQGSVYLIVEMGTLRTMACVRNVKALVCSVRDLLTHAHIVIVILLTSSCIMLHVRFYVLLGTMMIKHRFLTYVWPVFPLVWHAWVVVNVSHVKAHTSLFLILYNVC